MKTVKAEKVFDTRDMGYRHQVGDIEVGVTRMLFGYRVRAGKVDPERRYALSYHCDWCCGTNIACINLALNMIIGHLEAGQKLESLPTHSLVKPFYKDPEFMKKINYMHNGSPEYYAVPVAILQKLLNSQMSYLAGGLEKQSKPATFVES